MQFLRKQTAFQDCRDTPKVEQDFILKKFSDLRTKNVESLLIILGVYFSRIWLCNCGGEIEAK
jgi:hypothetical protein